MCTILLSNCSQSDAEKHQFRVRRVNGIQEAVSSGGPKYDDEIFDYELALSIEEDKEVEESLLILPSTYLASSDGRYFIIDSGDYRIAVFSPQGKFLFNIGQRGNGPGEFQSIGSLHFEGEYLQVWDYLAKRLNIFSLDGSFVRMVRPPERAAYTSGLRIANNGYQYTVTSDSKHELGLQ